MNPNLPKWAFYEKYKDDISSLSDDCLEIYELFGVDFNKTHKEFTIEYYNDWLFNYCFKDGLK
jgi:hypothetical protein